MYKISIIQLPFFFFLLTIGVSCSNLQLTSINLPKFPHQPRSYFFSDSIEIGRSVENRPIEAIIIGEGDDKILFIASIHGNETAGTPLLLFLNEYINDNPLILDNKQITLIPIINPDGFFKSTRHNANGVDLNRDFPTQNRVEPTGTSEAYLSQPETQAIIEVIEWFNPSRIISLHEPLNCIDYDGDGLELAKYLEGFTYLKVNKLGDRKGSLGSYSGEEKGIPTITLELPGNAATMNRENLWLHYGMILLGMISYQPQAILAK